jgi:hypothetical protein
MVWDFSLLFGLFLADNGAIINYLYTNDKIIMINKIYVSYVAQPT